MYRVRDVGQLWSWYCDPGVLCYRRWAALVVVLWPGCIVLRTSRISGRGTVTRLCRVTDVEQLWSWYCDPGVSCYRRRAALVVVLWPGCIVLQTSGSSGRGTVIRVCRVTDVGQLWSWHCEPGVSCYGRRAALVVVLWPGCVVLRTSGSSGRGTVTRVCRVTGAEQLRRRSWYCDPGVSCYRSWTVLATVVVLWSGCSMSRRRAMAACRTWSDRWTTRRRPCCVTGTTTCRWMNEWIN